MKQKLISLLTLTLRVDVTSTATTQEKVQEVIGETGGGGTPETPATPSLQELQAVKNGLEGTGEGERLPLTDENLDETLTAILEEAQVLEESQTLEDLNTNPFEQKVIEDITNDTFDDDYPPPPEPKYPIFHDDGPESRPHREVYWQNRQGNYVGLYEHYYDGVLEAQRFYDDDGKILWDANYTSVKTEGQKDSLQITKRSTYSNGYEIDSVRSETHYFYTEPSTHTYPPEYAIGQVSYTEQWIYKLAYDKHTGKYYKTDYRYYGSPHCDYDYADGRVFLAERNSGSETYWQGKEIYDRNGKLSMDAEVKEGKLYQTYYYTEKPAEWPFDPPPHEQRRSVYAYVPPEDASQYYAPSHEDLIRDEYWRLGFRNTDFVTDEKGNYISYTEHYGYNHDLEFPSQETEFIEVGYRIRLWR